MSVTTTTTSPTPARTTQHYGMRVPGDNDNADVPTYLGEALDDVDATLYAGVQAVNAAALAAQRSAMSAALATTYLNLGS